MCIIRARRVVGETVPVVELLGTLGRLVGDLLHEFVGDPVERTGRDQGFGRSAHASVGPRLHEVHIERLYIGTLERFVLALEIVGCHLFPFTGCVYEQVSVSGDERIRNPVPFRNIFPPFELLHTRLYEGVAYAGPVFQHLLFGESGEILDGPEVVEGGVETCNDVLGVSPFIFRQSFSGIGKHFLKTVSFEFNSDDIISIILATITKRLRSL